MSVSAAKQGILSGLSYGDRYNSLVSDWFTSVVSGMVIAYLEHGVFTRKSPNVLEVAFNMPHERPFNLVTAEERDAALDQIVEDLKDLGGWRECVYKVMGISGTHVIFTLTAHPDALPTALEFDISNDSVSTLLDAIKDGMRPPAWPPHFMGTIRTKYKPT